LGVMLGIGFLSVEDKLKSFLNRYSEKTRRRVYRAAAVLALVALLGLLFLFIFLGNFGFSFWVEWLLRVVIITVMLGIGTVVMAHSYD